MPARPRNRAPVTMCSSTRARDGAVLGDVPTSSTAMRGAWRARPGLRRGAHLSPCPARDRVEPHVGWNRSPHLAHRPLQRGMISRTEVATETALARRPRPAVRRAAVPGRAPPRPRCRHSRVLASPLPLAAGASTCHAGNRRRSRGRTTTKRRRRRVELSDAAPVSAVAASSGEAGEVEGTPLPPREAPPAVRAAGLLPRRWCSTRRRTRSAAPFVRTARTWQTKRLIGRPSVHSRLETPALPCSQQLSSLACGRAADCAPPAGPRRHSTPGNAA